MSESHKRRIRRIRRKRRQARARGGSEGRHSVKCERAISVRKASQSELCSDCDVFEKSERAR
jgi:hypothetical protein